MNGYSPQQDSYESAVWRLIVETQPTSGAWNMALDEAIMDAVATGAVPPTLRFYQWQPPCLSLGKRQPLDSVDLARCRADGVDVVRRATGGFAILHTDELTYSIAIRPDDPRASGAILDAYRRLSQGLLAGLERLGVSARMTPVAPAGIHNASAACFEVPSAYEIVVAGKKLIGSAQVRPGGRVLQHGSLPLAGDITRVVTYLACETEAARQDLRDHLRVHAATLESVIGRAVPFAESAAALRAGFASALCLTLVPGDVTDAERSAARDRLAEKHVARA